MSRDLSSSQSSAHCWGEAWTVEKLGILEKYLDAYTTALKHKDFALWYIDAFAGTGRISLPASAVGQDDEIEIKDGRAFLDGSAKIAADIRDKPFDKLIFIEKESARAESLQNRIGSDNRVDIRNDEANQELQRICQTTPWHGTRAVVFLDPFGTQVEWKTVKSLAQTQCIDVWILFPTMAARRLLPRDKLPEHEPRLNRVFGNDAWKDLYEEKRQPTLYEEEVVSYHSDRGTEAIVRRYREQMEKIFAGVSKAKSLRHPRKNSVLFDLVFAVSNPKAEPLAMRIARHILQM